MGGTVSSEDYAQGLSVKTGEGEFSCFAGHYSRLAAPTEGTITRDTAEAAGGEGLSAAGRHSDGKIGVSVSYDLILRRVYPDTPAATADLGRFVGRRISCINGHPVSSTKELFDRVGAWPTVTVTFDTEEIWHNGLPVWCCGENRLYSTSEGKWMLTGKGDAAMLANRGKLMSPHHGGQGPDAMPQWLSYVQDKGVWTEEDVQVQEHDGVLPPSSPPRPVRVAELVQTEGAIEI